MIIVEIKSDSRYPVDKKAMRRLVKNFLAGLGVDDVEVSIAIVGNRKMIDLAQKFLGKREIHSILSFSLENSQEDSKIGFVTPSDENLQLGDIVISYPEALKQAVEKNILIDEVIDCLVDHGLRRLLGEEENVLS